MVKCIVLRTESYALDLREHEEGTISQKGGMMSSDSSNLGLKLMSSRLQCTLLTKDFRVRQLSGLRSLPLTSDVICTVTLQDLSFLS